MTENRYREEAEEQRARADRAEAVIDRVRELADRTDEHLDKLGPCSGVNCAGCQVGQVLHHLRAALDVEVTR